MKTFVAVLITILVALGLSILITSTFVAIACFAFGITFTWKMAIGIWAILTLLQTVFSVRVTNGKSK